MLREMRGGHVVQPAQHLSRLRYLSSQVRQFDGQVFCSSGWGSTSLAFHDLRELLPAHGNRVRLFAGRQSIEPLLTRSSPSTVSSEKTVNETRGGYTSTETVKCGEEHAPDLPLGVVLPWRVCSGFAHGRPWAYLGLSKLDVTDTGEG